MSGLEGLAGTPQRVASPAVHAPTARAQQDNNNNNMDDLMGLFGNGSGMTDGGAGSQGTGGSSNGMDIMNGFAGLDLAGGGNQPPPPQTQIAQQNGGAKKGNEDILGLF